MPGTPTSPLDPPPPGAAAPDGSGQLALRLGSWAALSTGALGVVSLSLALLAVPIAGPHCPGPCARYPYTSALVAERVPRDYLWMYPATLLPLAVLVLVACLHETAPPTRRVLTRVALGLVVIAATVLCATYLVQATVAPASLERRRFEDWALFTQYNPNGTFIALEELGYLVLGGAFAALAPVFARGDRRDRALRWLLALAAAGIAVAFALVSALHGVDRQDRFEVPAITICWLALIAAAPLLASRFRAAIAREARA